MSRSILAGLLLAACGAVLHAGVPAPLAAQQPPPPHVWELQEIELRAARPYANPYVEVETWIELKGPGFARRVYGFWDGGDVFRVRFVATAPGEWSWTSGSNQPQDAGLNGRTGRFTARDWTEAEKLANPNRRGFLRADPKGHALQYADGTPYFLLGDTWLGAVTWRLPLTGKAADPAVEPGPKVTFEEAVAYRKRQGFNSVSMIAAFPTWATDQYPNTYADSKGVFYRNAWEEFGVLVPADAAGAAVVANAAGVATGTLPAGGGKAGGGTVPIASLRPTAKGMTDEQGYRPFEILPNREGLPDYDRIVPQFFRSLDRKMRLLDDQGFVPMLETIRRDVAPPWKAYFDFDESFGRFIQYMVARYGAWNMIFSKVHFDIYLPNLSLTADEFNQAINKHYAMYGPLPFGQPVTSLIDHATDSTFGTGAKAPWLTMHSTGNKPRDHAIYPAIERQFRLVPALPTADLEPHYTGWLHGNNVVNGEQAQPNSERDNYFSRAQMYGSVLSGSLAGHVHGTGAYDVTSGSEPRGARPYFWEALRFTSASYMRGLGAFVLSEGARYRDLVLASDDLAPRKAPGSSEVGLDGWSYQMRTPDRSFGLLYFEDKAVRPRSAGWTPNARYRLTWFDPRAGAWGQTVVLKADGKGVLRLPAFPAGGDVASTDWAAKLDLVQGSGAFDPKRDLLSLHYDHAPDLDDGQSATADRTILESLYGRDWLAAHVVPVSGAYGLNGPLFVSGSDTLMNAVWGGGGWLAAHADRAAAIKALADRWLRTLAAGGDIWVKEGGQSDMTAAVVAEIRRRAPDVETRRRIHVVQHSDWNENQTTPEALRYAKEQTDYIRIRDANSYLRVPQGDREFEMAALAHPRFASIWAAAFRYYPPTTTLDFSDTGELMHILGLGELGFKDFRQRFLRRGEGGK